MISSCSDAPGAASHSKAPRSKARHGRSSILCATFRASLRNTMKIAYRIAADGIWVVHFLLVLLVLFGWAVPSLWYVYMTALVATLISVVVYGYCILSKWEFDLRKKNDPAIDYNFTWASYYTYKLTNHRISNRFYTRASIVFLVFAIAINMYLRY